MFTGNGRLMIWPINRLLLARWSYTARFSIIRKCSYVTSSCNLLFFRNAMTSYYDLLGVARSIVWPVSFR